MRGLNGRSKAVVTEQQENIGVLTIQIEKPKISDGKSNGMRHSVWKAAENMGCDLRRCNFSTSLYLSL